MNFYLHQIKKRKKEIKIELNHLINDIIKITNAKEIKYEINNQRIIFFFIVIKN